MEIFLKNRLSFNYEITFLSCSASLPFTNTCVLANTGAWKIPEAFGDILRPLGTGGGDAVAFGFCLVFVEG